MASRTLIALGDDRIACLDRLARELGRSRSALIRDAVDRWIAEESDDSEQERRRQGLRAGFGAWKHRADIGESVEWQRRVRAEWTRPWDPDYDEVRAEFPELFDEDDDRERRRYKAGE